MHNKILIVILFGFSNVSLNGQINFKFDTSACHEDNFHKIKLNDKKVISALIGAEQYIKEILGQKIFRNNIRFDFCNARESIFKLGAKNIHLIESLGEDTCYELPFYVIEKTDTIGEFQLLIDKHGKTMKYEYPSDPFNHPELIRGFKKHFDNQFKCSYSQAIEIGRKRGFLTKPTLRCEIDNKFVNSINNEVFVKVKYYWSFLQIWDGGNEAGFEINAETGETEKEYYNASMPK